MIDNVEYNSDKKDKVYNENYSGFPCNCMTSTHHIEEPMDLDKAVLYMRNLERCNKMISMSKKYPIPINKYLVIMLGEILKTNDLSDRTIWQNTIYDLSAIVCKKVLEHFDVIESNDYINSTNVMCLKSLLCEWNGCVKVKIPITAGVFYDIYYHLTIFIQTNIKNLLKQMSIEYFNKVIMVICPLKTLKSLFYANPNGEEVFTVNPKNAHVPTDAFLIADSLMNWPFISIKLRFRSLELMHGSHFHNDFKIVNFNLKNKLILGEPMNMNLYYKPEIKENPKIFSTDLKKYLIQLIDHIENTKLVNQKRKYEVLTYLREFSRNLALADGYIEIGTEYYSSLFPYPYVRYFSNVNHLFLTNSNAADSNEIDVRLQQITYPAVKFAIYKFSTSHKNDNMSEFRNNCFDIEFRNNYLSYTCNLCNIIFNDTKSLFDVTEHIMEAHGYDPEYICSKCEKSFILSELCNARWLHDCQK